MSADPAPKKTIQGASDWALMSSVVTWVLSPNSAKKMVMKVDRKTRRKGMTGGVEGLGGDAVEGEGDGEEDTALGPGMNSNSLERDESSFVRQTARFHYFFIICNDLLHGN